MKGKFEIVISLLHFIMKGYRSIIHKLVIILFLGIIFTMVSYGALAKVTITAGEDGTALVDELVVFKGVVVVDGDYSWDFDDSVDNNDDGDKTNDNESSLEVATHKFDEAGTYIVTLTVSKDGEVTDVFVSEIKVVEPGMFTPWMLGLIFVIIGIVMLLAEASSPGFFIGIPATILIVIGLFGIAFPELFFTIWSPIIAAIVAVVATIGIITFYKKLAPPEPPTTTVGESLIGKKGMVIVDTDPDSLTTGKVKLGSDIWSATSARTLKEGTRVVVVASEGVHITVKEISKRSRSK